MLIASRTRPNFPETDATLCAPLRVVIVDEELPYPPNSGKRIRTLGLIERLARRHHLTYVCHRNADAAECRRAVEHFTQLGIRTIVIDRPAPPRSGPRFYGRLAANLLSPLPYSVTSNTSRALSDELRRLAAAEKIDLWHCEWTPMAEAMRDIPGRRLVMAHNVEALIWQRYYENETNFLKRWYIGKQWRKFLRFERAIVNEADITVAVSDLDRERFETDFGAQAVHVVDNGVDTKYFQPLNRTREPATLLFLGSFEWRPNLDGVAQLLDHVFPALRRERPDVRLLVVGRNPPPALRAACAGQDGVELHANVEDVRPFLARAVMLVVPLRIGGGSRLKILEALATGTPVVSTRVGAEGLHLEPDTHLTVVEGVAEIGAAILRSIRDPEGMAHQAAAGRREVLRRYDWETLALRLERLWLSCVHGGMRS